MLKHKMDKSELLSKYRNIFVEVENNNLGLSPRKLGQLSNKLHNELLLETAENIYIQEKRVEPLFLNYYCYVISMIESRHKIIPYTDIEFSRRIGEVWERFCNLILKNPFSSAEILKEPENSEFFQKLNSDIDNLSSNPRSQKINELKNLISSLVGNIDLKLDYFGTSGEIIYGIDFKSGFGSNEKGNTERILQVGNAYRYLEPATNLNVLVRQNENNNYMNKIENSGIWNVKKGKEAYLFLEDLSKCSVIGILENEFAFEEDFDSKVYEDIGKTVNNREKYLNWYQ